MGWGYSRGGYNKSFLQSHLYSGTIKYTIYCTRPVRLQTHFTVNWPGKMLRFSSPNVFLIWLLCTTQSKHGNVTVYLQYLHSAQFMKGEHYSVVKICPISDLVINDYMKIARFEQHSLLFPTLFSSDRAICLKWLTLLVILKWTSYVSEESLYATRLCCAEVSPLMHDGGGGVHFTLQELGPDCLTNPTSVAGTQGEGALKSYRVRPWELSLCTTYDKKS